MAKTTLYVCLECKSKAKYVTRGLCKQCHRDLKIRARYPPLIKKYRVREIEKTKHPLPKPTLAMPGTEAKISVLAERAKKAEELHHAALDATWDKSDNMAMQSADDILVASNEQSLRKLLQEAERNAWYDGEDDDD